LTATLVTGALKVLTSLAASVVNAQGSGRDFLDRCAAALAEDGLILYAQYLELPEAADGCDRLRHRIGAGRYVSGYELGIQRRTDIYFLETGLRCAGCLTTVRVLVSVGLLYVSRSGARSMIWPLLRLGDAVPK